MTALFHATATELLAQIRALEANPPRRMRAAGPPNRADMARRMGRLMAHAWLAKNPSPPDDRALTCQLMAQSPAWAHALQVAMRCKRALESMGDADFAWQPTGRLSNGVVAGAGNWPAPRQMVLYYFDVVGAHPGYFAGVENGLDCFCGLFGGFLGGDVSHWMPMPGLEDEAMPQGGQQD